MEIKPLSAEDKKKICSWRYDGKYSVYNMPDYSVLKAENRGFADFKKSENYVGYFLADILIGYTNTYLKNDEVFIGVGIKPDMCGKGIGTKIVASACNIAIHKYPGRKICLQVRTWNSRAIHCYQKAGFTIKDESYRLATPSGEDMFYKMEYSV